MTPLDITVMKKISKYANVIPVISKADSFTPEELADFKRRVKKDIDFYEIKIFPQADLDSVYFQPGSDELANHLSELEQLKVSLCLFRILFRFALLAPKEISLWTERQSKQEERVPVLLTVCVSNLVEDERYCEFTKLRNCLLRTHMQDLIESTAMVYYENFRTRQLLALKDFSKTAES